MTFTGAYTFQNLCTHLHTLLLLGSMTYKFAPTLDDAVHTKAPDLQGVVLGNPNAPPFSFPSAFCDASKAKRVLQLKEFRSLGECAVDTFKSIQAKLENFA